MKLTKEQVLGIVRHALTFIGGIVIARGLVDETLVTECIGGVLTLTGAIWSIIDKKVVTPVKKQSNEKDS